MVDKPAPKPRYTIRDAAYALQERPPIEQILGKIVSKGSVNVWVGKFGSKKTWSAISAGICVAIKKTWVGMEVKPGTVLFVDEESGEERLSRRLGMAIRGELGKDETPIKYVSLAQFNLLKQPNDAKILEALVEATGASLVIIDALADIMAGGDENQVKDTQPVFMALRKIAENTGAAIIVIHHTGKNNDYRGSSAIPGAIDTMLLIESPEGSNTITFRTLKNRDGEPVKFAAYATWTENQFYLTECDWPESTSLPPYQRFILDSIESNPDQKATIKQVADQAGELFKKSSISRGFRELVTNKTLVRLDAGGNGVAGTYGIRKEAENGEA